MVDVVGNMDHAQMGEKIDDKNNDADAAVDAVAFVVWTEAEISTESFERKMTTRKQSGMKKRESERKRREKERHVDDVRVLLTWIDLSGIWTVKKSNVGDNTYWKT